jgi:hypothetical protein
MTLPGGHRAEVFRAAESESYKETTMPSWVNLVTDVDRIDVNKVVNLDFVGVTLL